MQQHGDSKYTMNTRWKALYDDKCDQFWILKYPLITESVMKKKIDDNNTDFIADKKPTTWQ